MKQFDEKLAVKRVVKIIQRAFRSSKHISKNTTKKELNDIVTDVDVFMENSIIEGLLKFYPTHSFFAEESGETKAMNGEEVFQWFIDPIDGTVNFAAGLSLFGITVALQKNGETILGVTILPGQNEVYTAISGQGAYCNYKRLAVSTRKQLKDCIATVCLTSHYNKEHTEKAIDAIKKISPNARGVRIIVSAAVELCWLASGKIDAVVNIKPSVGLSSLAGKLFVVEAGGESTNTFGKQRERIDTTLCSNGLIHKEIVKLLK